eukprot:4730689-Pleurochrysis_carterae.AAC.1
MYVREEERERESGGGGKRAGESQGEGERERGNARAYVCVLGPLLKFVSMRGGASSTSRVFA